MLQIPSRVSQQPPAEGHGWQGVTLRRCHLSGITVPSSRCRGTAALEPRAAATDRPLQLPHSPFPAGSCLGGRGNQEEEEEDGGAEMEEPLWEGLFLEKSSVLCAARGGLQKYVSLAMWCARSQLLRERQRGGYSVSRLRSRWISPFPPLE